MNDQKSNNFINKEATKMIFKERKDFIIIGMTGRTGSGCTSIAGLFRKTFKDLAAPKPKERDFLSNEERKYNIVYKYAEENWEEFIVIELRNIITSFILEYNFDTFYEFVCKMLFDNSLHKMDSLDIKFKEYFESMHGLRMDIKEKTEDDEDYLKNDEVYDFYFNQLPHFTAQLIEKLSTSSRSDYTKLYQKIGSNIRRSGDPFDDKVLPENILKISQRTNTLIKVLRKRNIKTQKKVLVIIDALRNPFEVSFFKDRYSSFYLFSVNTDDHTRIRRLSNHDIRKSEIIELDNQEYPSKIKDVDFYHSQNIQKCIELSDVYLYNPDDNNKFEEVKKQLVRYISLIIHPGLVTPTHIERCMQIAFNAKLNSGCLSRQVGAVVTDNEYYIRAVGWNDSPGGQVPCSLRNMDALINDTDKVAYSTYESDDYEFQEFIGKNNNDVNDIANLAGRSFQFCFKDAYNTLKDKSNQVHTRALHAEENAFLQIVRSGGYPINGGYLFTTASPCELCSKKAYHLGIKRIYYIDPYPGISNNHVLDSGSKDVELILFNGAIGRAYTQFYTQIMPLKDEISMLIGFKFNNK